MNWILLVIAGLFELEFAFFLQKKTASQRRAVLKIVKCAYFTITRSVEIEPFTSTFTKYVPAFKLDMSIVSFD